MSILYKKDFIIIAEAFRRVHSIMSAQGLKNNEAALRTLILCVHAMARVLKDYNHNFDYTKFESAALPLEVRENTEQRLG